jgi:hypothetical protein
LDDSRGATLFSIYLKFLKRKITPVTLLWRLTGSSVPAPFKVKFKTLLRSCIDDADWIETGTYLGDTTKLIAKSFPNNKVVSLEPDYQLFRFSKLRLKRTNNVLVFNLSSESGLPQALDLIHDKLNIWLDGHYSGDVTYLGESLTPILFELRTLGDTLEARSEVTIFVDDFRLFGVDPGYPKAEALIEWAEIHHLRWHVENDIFVAKKTSK